MQRRISAAVRRMEARPHNGALRPAEKQRRAPMVGAAEKQRRALMVGAADRRHQLESIPTAEAPELQAPAPHLLNGAWRAAVAQRQIPAVVRRMEARPHNGTRRPAEKQRRAPMVDAAEKHLRQVIALLSSSNSL